MPTPTVITDLSTTAASNYPAGSDSPNVLDDVQRAHAAFIAQLRDDPSANLTTVIPVAKGGTGAATAPLARAALSVAPRATRIDIASVAGTVDLTTNAPDTDDIRITGALAITAFTVAIGRVIRVTASGASTLTNNANIVTNTGANIVCAAGDTYVLRATAANTVEVISFVAAAALTVPLAQSRGGTGTVLATRQLAQSLSTSLATVATGTTIIPIDDTIPQNTEGDQYLSLAITPVSATSTLEIEIDMQVNNSAVGWPVVALFQDSTVGALAAKPQYQSTATGGLNVRFVHRMTSGTTSATTFKVRAGCQSGTLTVNGAAGGRYMGGVGISSMVIKEYLA